MVDRQEQIIQEHPILGWFLRWTAYCVAGVSYLFGLFMVQHTLFSFFLLTGIYGAWLLIYHMGRRHAHPGWLLALFGLACASLFISMPSTNVYWLPILPVTTACAMTLLKSRSFGLLTASALWLITSLALSFVSQQWDIGGQVILLISFGSTYGCTAMISELAEAHRQLQKYSAQMEELSVIHERNRIAREIHDTLGHTLTLLAVQLETATQLEMRDDPRLHEELLEARRVAKACLTDVRRSVEALRPGEISSDSLQKQLRNLVAASETACSQTQVTLDLDEATHPLHPELRLALYRCAQEALTNIRKHAHATKVLLRLSTSAEQGGQVELTVLDNGQGSTLPQEQREPGFGLLGMSERVALLGGTLRAGPEPGHGWRVEAILPLKGLVQSEDATPQAHVSRARI